MLSANINQSSLVCAQLALCVAAIAGCERSTSVGSGCVNGVCPQALFRDDEACTVKTTTGAIAITTLPSSPFHAPYCLGTPLLRNAEGSTNARVYYGLTSESVFARHCTDVPFLRPVSETIDDLYTAEYEDAEICELNQLAVTDSDGGQRVAAGDGFYYDDFSEEMATLCESGMGIFITEGARPWNHAYTFMMAVETRDANGELDEDLVCNPLMGSEPIGTPCLPGQRVYDDNDVVIETRAESCGDGVCMAYHLEGDTDPTCEPQIVGERDGGGPLLGGTCASAERIAERAYCTCRCDGPPGADLCQCPDNFSCVEVVPSLAPGLEGTYCVKNAEEP